MRVALRPFGHPALINRKAYAHMWSTPAPFRKSSEDSSIIPKVLILHFLSEVSFLPGAGGRVKIKG